MLSCFTDFRNLPVLNENVSILKRAVCRSHNVALRIKTSGSFGSFCLLVCAETATFEVVSKNKLISRKAVSFLIF
jgi:hypothetical protein